MDEQAGPGNYHAAGYSSGKGGKRRSTQNYVKNQGKEKEPKSKRKHKGDAARAINNPNLPKAPGDSGSGCKTYYQSRSAYGQGSPSSNFAYDTGYTGGSPGSGGGGDSGYGTAYAEETSWRNSADSTGPAGGDYGHY